MTDPTPIACALTRGEYAERIAWIAELNRSLLDHEQRGLELLLKYPSEEKNRVQELVWREESCCGFLRFSIDESATTVELRILAPAETRDAIDAIFAPFLGGRVSSEQPAFLRT